MFPRAPKSPRVVDDLRPPRPVPGTPTHPLSGPGCVPPSDYFDSTLLWAKDDVLEDIPILKDLFRSTWF